MACWTTENSGFPSLILYMASFGHQAVVGTNLRDSGVDFGDPGILMQNFRSFMQNFKRFKENSSFFDKHTHRHLQQPQIINRTNKKKNRL
ncbi:hypothetical protein JSY36_11980 [Bacillus sp. H-16]|uniref:hypothetical protein n=1 Tax=Alteribacter salitolerans TaxID=2912333 RepID=UPI00196422DB|nr:hypothetical protein [Alteribacter salitolerans]MBM7096465.1 hypothetical protein [Alteribacter salitolerans]